MAQRLPGMVGKVLVLLTCLGVSDKALAALDGGSVLSDALTVESLSVAAREKDVWVGEEEGVLKFASPGSTTLLDVRLRVRTVKGRSQGAQIRDAMWEVVPTTADGEAESVDTWTLGSSAWEVGIRAGAHKGVCWRVHSTLGGSGVRGGGGEELACRLGVEAGPGALRVEAVA
eukprot:2890989-Rhodomonas_salina.1